MEAAPNPYAPPPSGETAPSPAPVGSTSGFRVWHFMVGVLICALAFMVFAAGPILLALGVVGLVMILARRRSTHQEALLEMLAIAARRGLPPGPAVEAFAEMSGGRSRLWAGRLAGLLDAGVSLPDALRAVPKVVPPDAKLLIRVGAECGDLPGALREASDVQRSKLSTRTNLMPPLLYLVAVATVMQAICGYILYFIIPKFEAIFRDFGVELPAPTIAVIRASHVLADGPLMPMLFLAELLLLAYLPFSYFGWASGYAPALDRLLLSPFDRLFARSRSALILRAMARGIRAGRPAGAILEALERHHPSEWVRRRLARTAEDVRGGADVWRSLERRGLIRPADAALLDSAARVGNLDWALREVAEGIERRGAYRVRFWLQLLFPAVVVLMGGLVLLLTSAFFLPLITLIGRLSG